MSGPVMASYKYAQAADSVRAQIADGTLRPGDPAPSGAAIARRNGCSALTARKALRSLINDGTLIPGPSRNARPMVAGPDDPAADRRNRARAGRELSGALATRRRAAGLTQHELGALAGFSLTAIGHAETGRLWQSRRFWEYADKELSAGGELLTLHDAYRAATAPADAASTAEDTGTEAIIDTPPPTIAVALSGPVTCVTITWADGEATTVYPPETPARPSDATPVNWPRG
jgi:DNA-binding transcriptional regulator YhcF (GntR family)